MWNLERRWNLLLFQKFMIILPNYFLEKSKFFQFLTKFLNIFLFFSVLFLSVLGSISLVLFYLFPSAYYCFYPHYWIIDNTCLLSLFSSFPCHIHIFIRTKDLLPGWTGLIISPYRVKHLHFGIQLVKPVKQQNLSEGVSPSTKTWSIISLTCARFKFPFYLLF